MSPAPNGGNDELEISSRAELARVDLGEPVAA